MQPQINTHTLAALFNNLFKSHPASFEAGMLAQGMASLICDTAGLLFNGRRIVALNGELLSQVRELASLFNRKSNGMNLLAMKTEDPEGYLDAQARGLTQDESNALSLACRFLLRGKESCGDFNAATALERLAFYRSSATERAETREVIGQLLLAVARGMNGCGELGIGNHEENAIYTSLSNSLLPKATFKVLAAAVNCGATEALFRLLNAGPGGGEGNLDAIRAWQKSVLDAACFIFEIRGLSHSAAKCILSSLEPNSVQMLANISSDISKILGRFSSHGIEYAFTELIAFLKQGESHPLYRSYQNSASSIGRRPVFLLALRALQLVPPQDSETAADKLSALVELAEPQKALEVLQLFVSNPKDLELLTIRPEEGKLASLPAPAEPQRKLKLPDANIRGLNDAQGHMLCRGSKRALLQLSDAILFKFCTFIALFSDTDQAKLLGDEGNTRVAIGLLQEKAELQNQFVAVAKRNGVMEAIRRIQASSDAFKKK